MKISQRKGCYYVPIGLILLFALAGLIYFGLAHRVLDRLRLTDTQALLFVGLIIVGSFITIPISRGALNVSVNVGGALVPVALAVYLLLRADSTWEWVRALLAAAGTAAIIWIVASFTDFEPPANDFFIDPVWLYSLVGGVVAYLLGRSRRAAFVAGTLGVVMADLGHLVQVWVRNLPSTVALGGAGAFDAVVIAGLLSVGLAEIVGETRERLQGGPVISGERPQALRQDEGVFDNETEDEKERNK